MGRHNLYMFRCNMKLTQEEIAAKIGVCRTTYSMIEKGQRGGSSSFWTKLQKIFEIPDSEMWKLQKLCEEGTKQ